MNTNGEIADLKQGYEMSVEISRIWVDIYKTIGYNLAKDRDIFT